MKELKIWTKENTPEAKEEVRKILQEIPEGTINADSLEVYKKEEAQKVHNKIDEKVRSYTEPLNELQNTIAAETKKLNQEGTGSEEKIDRLFEINQALYEEYKEKAKKWDPTNPKDN